MLYLRCPVCEKIGYNPRPGRFRCSGCGSPVEIGKDFSVKVLPSPGISAVMNKKYKKALKLLWIADIMILLCFIAPIAIPFSLFILTSESPRETEGKETILYPYELIEKSEKEWALKRNPVYSAIPDDSISIREQSRQKEADQWEGVFIIILFVLIFYPGVFLSRRWVQKKAWNCPVCDKLLGLEYERRIFHHHIRSIVPKKHVRCPRCTTPFYES